MCTHTNSKQTKFGPNYIPYKTFGFVLFGLYLLFMCTFFSQSLKIIVCDTVKLVCGSGAFNDQLSRKTPLSKFAFQTLRQRERLTSRLRARNNAPIREKKPTKQKKKTHKVVKTKPVKVKVVRMTPAASAKPLEILFRNTELFKILQSDAEIH